MSNVQNEFEVKLDPKLSPFNWKGKPSIFTEPSDRDDKRSLDDADYFSGKFAKKIVAHTPMEIEYTNKQKHVQSGSKKKLK